MKFICSAIVVLFSLTAFAQEGKVLKVLGGTTAHVLREGNKLPLTIDFEIFQGDEIFSEDTVVVLHLFPSTQISLSKNTHIRIDQNLIAEDEAKEKNISVIGFLKGIIRLHVTKDSHQELEQKVQAEGVAFSVRGTDYEISLDGDLADLDVHEGAVEVSSPDVMTFVPEIVKSGKGFRFNRKQKSFASRKFRPKFKSHPGFMKDTEIRKQWLLNKENRKIRQMERKAKKEKQLQGLKERKEFRRTKRKEKKNNR